MRCARAHFEHHRRPGSDTDPDFHPGRPRAFVPWLIRFFGGYYTHMMLALITVRIWVYVVLGAAPSHIILFWGVPSVLAVFQLFYFGTFLPHRHGERRVRGPAQCAIEPHGARGGGGELLQLRCLSPRASPVSRYAVVAATRAAAARRGPGPGLGRSLRANSDARRGAGGRPRARAIGRLRRGRPRV